MSASLLALFSAHGVWVLLAALHVAALGVPFVPATLLLLAAGALAEDLGLNLATVAPLALAASVSGDQAGYFIGRLAGGKLVPRVAARKSLAPSVTKAQALLAKNGMAGIFLTRWLITPAGPYVNLIAGALTYPWWRFSLAAVAGEAVWIALYVGAGRLAGTGIEELAAFAGNITWLVLGLIVAFTAWRLLQAERTGRAWTLTRQAACGFPSTARPARRSSAC